MGHHARVGVVGPKAQALIPVARFPHSGEGLNEPSICGLASCLGRASRQEVILDNPGYSRLAPPAPKCACDVRLTKRTRQWPPALADDYHQSSIDTVIRSSTGRLSDRVGRRPANELHWKTLMGAEHNLLFGLLALQTGLIDQTALVAAFHAWTRDKARSLADHLIALGHIDRRPRAGRRGAGGLACAGEAAATSRRASPLFPPAVPRARAWPG